MAGIILSEMLDSLEGRTINHRVCLGWGVGAGQKFSSYMYFFPCQLGKMSSCIYFLPGGALSFFSRFCPTPPPPQWLMVCHVNCKCCMPSLQVYFIYLFTFLIESALMHWGLESHVPELCNYSHILVLFAQITHKKKFGHIAQILGYHFK